MEKEKRGKETCKQLGDRNVGVEGTLESEREVAITLSLKARTSASIWKKDGEKKNLHFAK